MIYKIGILGASGRMGLEVAALLADDYSFGSDHFELADAVSLNKKLTSIEGVDVRTLDEPEREPVHAWIDFSRPEATVKLLRSIRTPVVVATTGFNAEQRSFIEAYAREQRVCIAPNTSPGVSFLDGLLASAPRAEGFTVVLDETHHAAKKDAPSGTALALAQTLEAKEMKPLPILSVRAGGAPGVHRIRFISDEEEVEIVHRVWDRRVFAKGALEAVALLLKKTKPGLYTIRQLREGAPK